LSAHHPFQGGDPRLVFLEQVGCLHIVVQSTRFELADPDTDQLARDVVPLGQRVQRLAPDELLSNLPFERGTV
jgi:hypothetical protein